ncbi:LOW QUALITY PROTEIN: elongation factor-like GTPase 1 [Homalodisca vitripennis]|uniref:LOW QUALITY PROTEIN: elongation factor-like GTPase 1 n=1 Tax=Homalodisca vitripennis TaxID=197043 RepID=UPI001EEB740E|nr:LOW QUALITY PROTEIN: elongation factor-like GTPase 1 [Homalodisca vitripennis]
MRQFSLEKLSELQNSPKNIRNICIMAHVDHGKTTLADSLVASNGIISQKMAGKLRYMDSRKDEQERGITMKSSSIALYYKKGDSEEYLVNLIDSPGHVDFSSEVCTAMRLCDGAIVVVDVVEGVCPQTQVALKQAWLENIRPVLLLNKIDRLILEMKLSPLDAYIHLTQVLEQVNAVTASLFTTDVLSRQDMLPSSGNTLQDWSAGLENADDSQLYFSPDQGNVVFASAADGWGFCVKDFAAMYATKLGVSVEELSLTLWGDYYLHSKTRKVTKGAQEKAKKPLFVQLVLENLWSVYENIVVRKDKEKLMKMVESLNVKMTARDLRHTDSKVQLQAFCSQWLPLASTVLDMVCAKLPSPCEILEEKVERLMCPSNQSWDSLPPESQALKKAFLTCSSDPEAPIIVFISKMFPLERKCLPQNRPRVLTPEEIAQRREQARLRHANQIAGLGLLEGGGGEGERRLVPPYHPEDDDVFIAFARVFSGRLRKGTSVYVLGPKHDPAVALQKMKQGEEIDLNLTLKDLKAGQHITRVTVNELYLMMGRELETLEEVPAGNVLGIGGLEDHVLKTATLSTDLACPAFRELQLLAVPILRVAVEPTRPADLLALVRGLRLLNQADACVQVMVQETGEHVIVTAGEVHLERCVEDLQHRYAKVPVNVSEPIVPFRETIVPPPTVDMVNEAIQDQQIVVKKETGDEAVGEDGVVTMYTANKQSVVKLRAVPLPQDVTTFLENHQELIRTMDRHLHAHGSELSETMQRLTVQESTVTMGEKTKKAMETFRTNLGDLLDKAGGVWSRSTLEEIWCFGPRRCGPNLLINRIPSHLGRNIWNPLSKEGCQPNLLEYDSSFVNGFQMATLAGPLCEEPMMGVAFVVEDWSIEQTPDVSGSSAFGPLSGQIMSAVKEGCRKAFQAQPQRLMAAMYSCQIQANAEILGKMYGVLNRRHGRVLHGDMTQGSSTFSVQAVLPVVESFLFAPEMRKQTSGLASPQLIFSHWEVIDVDPFWSPRTEEEYLHYGEKADSENRARKYMDQVRRRKGLLVQQKIVQFAEKQRTLGKNK